MGLKTKIIISVATVMLALIWLQALRINKLTEERDRFESNTSALLSAVTMWRTKDSLNVAKAEVLSLRLAEMERYRAEDLKTIESLKIKKKELEQITTMQMQTIANIKDTYGTPTFDCKQYDELYELMLHDKKNLGTDIRFTLLGDIGDIRIDCTIGRDEIFEMLDFVREC